VFETDTLDERNWVVDFGGLDDLKDILRANFDHTTLVSYDDPEIDWFREADARGILRLVELPYAGCERFSEMVFQVTKQWLEDAGFSPRCRLISVEVSEHGANSAIYSE